MALSDKLEYVHDAFHILANNLDDKEMVEVGLAFSGCIMERLTDAQTARDAREHIRAYIWGIIDAYIDGKMEVENGK